MSLDGCDLDLGGPRQRALLALLALSAGSAVPPAQLIDALWGDAPPASASHALDVYASRLRKALSGAATLERRGGSFRLNVADDAVDVGRFERLLVELRAASDPSERLVLAERALGLWRGHALADLSGEPFARRAAGRLEEERCAAHEEEFDALLALGRHVDAIPRLQAFVAEHPLRERARIQLMLALYRAGRQSDALDEYRVARTVLLEELGLEPSRELRELEAMILRHDVALELRGAVVPHQPSSAGRIRLRRRLLIACAAVALVGAAFAAIALRTSGGRTSLDRVDFNGIAAIDPSSGRIMSEIVPAVSTNHLAADGARVWATNDADDTVSGIERSPETIVHTVAVGSSPAGIATGGRAVWIANLLSGSVSRVDPVSERVVETIRVGNAPTGVAFGAGSVWVTNAGAQTVSRIDPKIGRVQATYPTHADGRAVAFGAGSVWVIDGSTDSVVQLEPRSGTIVRTVRVGSGPAAIAFAFASIWVANSFDGTVSRVDPATGVVIATVDVGGSPLSLASTARRLWVADPAARELVALDPASNTLAERVSIGGTPVAIAATPTKLWLAVAGNPAVHRGGTLRVVSPLGSLDSIDPALTYTPSSAGVLTLTNDGLVGFRRASGSAGTQIVPDLAVGLPAPTDGGTTYTFQLRRALQYSNGVAVSPTDFRFVLERDFKLHSPAARFYTGIVGGSACARDVARCDLSRGVLTDAAANTVTFRLTAPDPDFLDKLAMPAADALPSATTPMRPQSTPLPATGPYVFARYSPHRRVVLVRNPRFRVWSTVAQPPGFPDRIDWNASTGLDAAAHAIEAGTADVMSLFGPAPDLLHEMQTQHASQVHFHPLAALESVFMNTRLPPFDDIRVRRALDAALDRDEIVRLQGGPQVAETTCLILPPLIPGSQAGCPFAHDLAAARALVRSSATRGMRVRLWSYRAEPYATEMRYVGTVLEKLGYRVTLVYPGDAVYYKKISDSRTRAQVGILSSLADYPTPGDFFSQFACAAFQPGSATNVDPAEFCDPRTDALIARASRVVQTDPEAARRAWAAVDRRLADRAPVAPLFVNRAVDLVSLRVGNYEFSPQWGVLLDQLWVR